MNLRLWILALGLFLCIPAFAQEGEEIDLTKLTANRKTFVFNDSKHTVKKYINTQLQKETACCGENDDRIYLEVRIDPTGYVVSAKAITGKNECFKQSAEDLVKRVKWEANDSRGPKSIYIELRPKVECTAGRDNSYEKLAIFNNKLMDEEGNRVSMANTEKLIEMVDPSTKKTPEAETKPAEKVEEKIAEAAPEKTEEVKETVTEKTKEIAENTKETANNTEEAAKEMAAETKEVAEEKIAEATPMTSTAKEEAAEPVEMTPEEKAAAEKAAAEQAVKAEEINKLREQMAELRAKKAEEDAKQAEIERKKKLRAERIAAKKEKIRKAKEAKAAEEAIWGPADDSEGEGDGSWTEGEGGESGEMSEADRLREEIRRLQDQEREMEEARQLREEEVRRQMDENDRSAQEMIQIAEERLRVEEQLYQVEEQEELNVIEKDRQNVEDARREQENEYQRIQDEINRLQQEAQLKIQDLERQRADLEALQARKQMREQEIMLERAKRELEREARLEAIRLDMVNNSVALQGQNSSARGLSSSIDNDALLNEILPDLTTKADSEALKLLLQQIQAMQQELISLRAQIATVDAGIAGGTSTPPTSGSNAGIGTSRSADDPNVKSAANNRDWEGTDYIAPGKKKEQYIVTKSNIPPPPSNTGQKGPTRPDPSNPETHDNMEIPKFAPRKYVDGKDAMKNLIKDRLRLGGICGLAHTVFSVTLDPSGNVVAYSVLTSNNANVMVQMKNIIPSLKFNAVDQRFNQTIYQEVKAEILCNGAEDKVNLKEVKDIIKEGN
ncbi:MAG: hypothetical protein AAF696_03730 [Bacteroidota bacterium]